MANLISNLEGFTLPNMHDRWRWSLSGDGEYSVASVRNLIDDRTLAEVGAKTRWIKYVPIKVNILAWRIKLNNLPSRLNLSRRGLDLDTIFCPSCNSAVESSNHIFFGCPMVKDLYKFLARWWDVSMTTFSSYDEWWNWIKFRHDSKYEAWIPIGSVSREVRAAAVKSRVMLWIIGLMENHWIKRKPIA
ncbi:RNA-directed DNA polymerase, eukaryota [Tanacetum coccineum]